MTHLIQQIKSLLTKPYSAVLVLGLIIIGVYYKLFIFGKIPFPADLLVVSYSPWLDYYKLPVQNPLISDAFSQFFLWKYLAIETFKNWQWPLWNPYSFMGTPLLATYHSATLYPLNILLFLPRYFGWGIFIFSQTLISAISMYLLLSIWLDSKLARLSGAIIFAFGGLMTTWLEFGTAIHAIAWLPLSLYLTEKYWKTFKIRYLLMLTGSLTLLILAGNTQILTYSFVILLAYTFIMNLPNSRKFLTRFFPIFLSCILAILISASQLLPTLELFQKSMRINDPYITDAYFGLLPIGESLRLFIADFFGNPVTRNYWGFLNYLETSGFMGSATLPLLIFAIFYLKKHKTSIFFFLLFCLSLLLTFQNPLSLAIYQTKIPILTASYASRMLFISSFSASILSAFSVNQIIKMKQADKLFTSVTWSLASLIGIFLGTLFTYLYISKSTQNILSNVPADQNNLIVSLRNTTLPIVIMVFLFIASLLAKTARKWLTAVICILIVLLIFDLGRYFLKFNPFVSQDLIFPNTPSLKFLETQPGIFRIGREHAEVLPPNTWAFYKLQSFEGYDPLYLNQYAKFINFLNSNDIKSGAGRYAELISNYKSAYLDAANVKYFIAILRDQNRQIPGNLLDKKLAMTDYETVFKDTSSVILQNPHAKERGYFAKNILLAPTQNIENAFMEDKSFNPTETIMLSGNLYSPSVTGKGNARIMYYSPNIVKIKTETQSEEILVLADQYDEGWEARIDGNITAISRANLIFRAIKVPAGSHDIIFTYHPKGFEIGLKIALVSLFLVTALSIVAIKIRKF